MRLSLVSRGLRAICSLNNFETTRPAKFMLTRSFKSNFCTLTLTNASDRFFSRIPFDPRRRMSTQKFDAIGTDKYMVWVDLEMTGLNLDKDEIIEMACIVTDKDLNIVAEGPELVVNVRDELLDGMDEWCTKTHTESGLVEQVKQSKITIQQADEMMTEFLRKCNVPPGVCPIAGNSVHVDKRFVDKYMPKFSVHLHYRIIDVSTVKEIAKRWYPTTVCAKNKSLKHRALSDIKESIDELIFYRDNVFKSPQQ